MIIPFPDRVRIGLYTFFSPSAIYILFQDKGVDDDVRLLLFESFGGFGKGVGEILWDAANVLQNKLTRAQYLDEVTWTTKSWLGLQKQRISVVLHTAIAEQIVNELANGEGGRVHGAKCLAVLAGVA